MARGRKRWRSFGRLENGEGTEKHEREVEDYSGGGGKSEEKFHLPPFHFYTGDGEDPTVVSEKANHGAHMSKIQGWAAHIY